MAELNIGKAGFIPSLNDVISNIDLGVEIPFIQMFVQIEPTI